MKRLLKRFLVLFACAIMLLAVAAKEFPTLVEALPEQFALNKPAPHWFKVACLAVSGVMALSVGLMDAIRLLRGKPIYITSRLTSGRWDRGFWAVLFTLTWLGGGVLLLSRVFFP